MKKPNSNERLARATIRIAAYGDFRAFRERARMGQFRQLAATEMRLAGSYVSDLLAGRVHANYRAEFIAAARECIASARQFREEGRA